MRWKEGSILYPKLTCQVISRRLIKVYPELSCTGEAGWGEEFSYPICPSRPENYQFVQSIIDEMVEIFPSEYFHIGADEVEKDNWEQCEVCQRLMQQEGYQKVDELQNRFVKIMTNYVKGKGKKVMGWDDAFLEKEPQDLIYTYWRDWLPDSAGKDYPERVSDYIHGMVPFLFECNAFRTKD